MTSRKPLSLASAVVAALVLAVAALGGARAGTATEVAQSAHEQAAPFAAALAAEPSSGGPSDGIRVHGHWTIQLVNEDGTLGERREFDNALVPSGAAALSLALARERSVGPWEMVLQSATVNDSPCLFSNGSLSACYVTEPGFFAPSSTSSSLFQTLQVGAPLSGPNAFAFQLSGTATAARSGSIGAVDTDLLFCPANVAPSTSCGAGPAVQFTSKNVTPVVPVSPGQQIQVTVVISFS